MKRKRKKKSTKREIMFKSLLVAAILLFSFSTSLCSAAENSYIHYRGDWVTTSRPLNGVMDCYVYRGGKDTLKCHFVGMWYGQSYDYWATFTGKQQSLSGTAPVDGTPYRFNAKINKYGFNCDYSGMYDGYFRLKRVK